MFRQLSENTIVRSVYGNRSDTERALVLSSLFACVMLAARILYTGSVLFVFLPWNLFLASVPYFITEWMWRKPVWLCGRIRTIAVLATWLLFLPNAFYIITDLFHLHQTGDVPLWFDLALLLSFAWSGILFGVLSVRRMEKLMAVFFPAFPALVLVVVLMWLNALGVYIGRYLRFNSWDVLTNPFQLAADISYLVVHPLRNPGAWGMIACYALFLSLLYYCLGKISQIFHQS